MFNHIMTGEIPGPECSNTIITLLKIRTVINRKYVNLGNVLRTYLMYSSHTQRPPERKCYLFTAKLQTKQHTDNLIGYTQTKKCHIIKVM